MIAPRPAGGILVGMACLRQAGKHLIGRHLLGPPQARLNNLIIAALQDALSDLEADSSPAGSGGAGGGGAGDGGTAAAPKQAPRSIVACAVQAARAEGTPLNLEDLLSQVKTFIFAGAGMLAVLRGRVLWVQGLGWGRSRQLRLSKRGSGALCAAHAGHDTTASMIAWCVYALTQHPEAERKLVQELDEVGCACPAGGPRRRAPSAWLRQRSHWR